MELTVYILLCADGSYYTGSTKQEIEARVWEHNEGVYENYTKSRRPVKLVFTETYERLTDGFARERQIKGWSREKKERLIKYWYEGLPPVSGRGRVTEKLEKEKGWGRPSRRRFAAPQDEGRGS